MKNNKDTLMSIASSTAHKDISNLNVNIIDDLNMDSLDAISFLFEVENEFNIKIPEEDIDKLDLFNLNKLYDYVSRQL
jgi:acyl carrier protein